MDAKGARLERERALDALGLSEEDVSCPLCHMVLTYPVTSPCGHNFCRSCIVRALDFNNRCPMCRTVIFITGDHSPNLMLRNIVHKLYPEEVQSRETEENASFLEYTKSLPLFIIDMLLVPDMPLNLHVYELRYRNLVAHCMQGERAFGVIQLGQKVGTVARIQNVFKFPDGRSVLHCKGDSRFKVLDRWTDPEGYQCAKIEMFEDDDVPAEDAEGYMDMLHACAALTNERMQRLTASERNSLESAFGRPNLADGKQLSLWLLSILPIPAVKKTQLLTSTSAMERLTICHQVMEENELCFVLENMAAASRKRYMWVLMLLIGIVVWGVSRMGLLKSG